MLWVFGVGGFSGVCLCVVVICECLYNGFFCVVCLVCWLWVVLFWCWVGGEVFESVGV